MASESLHYLSLLDLSEKLKSGAVTSLAATEAILGRIARYDPTLKSYATVCGDRALAKARAADAELRQGRWRGPLHGVPVAVKDLCFTDYAPTAAGMPIHRGFTPAYNATVVARLEATGAVVLGKLNRTEAAYAPITPRCRSRSIRGTPRPGPAPRRRVPASRPPPASAMRLSAPTPAVLSAFPRPTTA